MLNSTMEDNLATPLNINDLIVLRQITEVACARGAFRAEELTTIGSVYDKLNTWLLEIAPPQETESEGETNA